MLTLVLLLQAPAAEPLKPEDPGKLVEQKTWVGCVQAGSVPSTYRLNLDPGTAVVGPDDPVSLGDPFVQLVADTTKMNLTRFVGKHVKVTGKALSPEEAAREAANRPHLNVARETPGGTGGRPQRHTKYVKVEKVENAPGECK